MYDNIKNMQSPDDHSSLADLDSNLMQDASDHRRHGFVLGATGLLLPEGMMCEVRNGLPVSRLPNSPEWIIGMVNLRGNITPILDLALLLNIEVVKSTQQKQLFLLIDENWIGLYSNGLPKLLYLTPDELVSKIPTVSKELDPFVRGCYQQKLAWLDCDVKGIFSWIAEKVHV